MARLSFRAVLLLAAVIIFCFTLGVVVSAAAPDIEETNSTDTLPWDDTSEIIQISEEEYKELLDKRNVVVIDDPMTTVSPVTPSDSNGLKAIMLSLIGDYDPVVIEYSYTSSQGYVSYLREIEPDYAWMISAAVFVVVLYSFFRILGVILKRD